MGPTDGLPTVDDGRTGVGGCADVDGWADVVSLVGWLGSLGCPGSLGLLGWAAVGWVACVGLVPSGRGGTGCVEWLDAAPVEGAGSVGSTDVHRAVD